MPQGSVLGLLLIILYTAGLVDLIEGYGLHPDLYANNTQTPVALGLRTCFSPPCQLVGFWLDVVKSLTAEHCEDRDPLMFDDTLAVHLPSAAARVGENHVLPSTTICDLGVIVDSHVVMRCHVSCTVSGCFAVLRQLCSIRHSVSNSELHSLVLSLVTPCLYYGNTTHTGLPASQLLRL